LINEKYFEHAFTLHDPTEHKLHWQAIFEYALLNKKLDDLTIEKNKEIVEFFNKNIKISTDSMLHFLLSFFEICLSNLY
jgi:hypothetical protein